MGDGDRLSQGHGAACSQPGSGLSPPCSVPGSGSPSPGTPSTSTSRKSASKIGIQAHVLETAAGLSPVTAVWRALCRGEVGAARPEFQESSPESTTSEIGSERGCMDRVTRYSQTCI